MTTLTESSFVQRAGYGVRTLVAIDGDYEYELTVSGPDPRSLASFTLDVQGVEVEDTTGAAADEPLPPLPPPVQPVPPVTVSDPDPGVIGTDTNTTEGV